MRLEEDIRNQIIRYRVVNGVIGFIYNTTLNPRPNAYKTQQITYSSHCNIYFNNLKTRAFEGFLRMGKINRQLIENDEVLDIFYIGF